jgi:hypothetical protein
MKHHPSSRHCKEAFVAGAFPWPIVPEMPFSTRTMSLRNIPTTHEQLGQRFNDAMQGVEPLIQTPDDECYQVCLG